MVVDDDLEYVDDCYDNEEHALFKNFFSFMANCWIELSRSYPLMPPPGGDVYGGVADG